MREKPAHGMQRTQAFHALDVPTPSARPGFTVDEHVKRISAIAGVERHAASIAVHEISSAPSFTGTPRSMRMRITCLSLA
jgi:hypothetical protein